MYFGFGGIIKSVYIMKTLKLSILNKDSEDKINMYLEQLQHQIRLKSDRTSVHLYPYVFCLTNTNTDTDII